MDRTVALIEWAKANGAYIDDAISFEPIVGRGTSAVIKKDVSGKDLIKIPENLLLTPKTAEHFYNIRSDRNQQVQLMLARLKFGTEDLILDGVNLSDHFKPFIDFLPASGRETGLPYFWTEAQKEALHGTDAEVFLQRYMDAIVEDWYTALKASALDLLEEYVNFYNQYKHGDYNKGMGVMLSLPITSWLSFPAYLWAYCIFASRGFPHLLLDPESPIKVMLVPVLDLLNHENDAPVTWKVENDDLVFTTEQKLTANFELFNNYGDRSNTTLLLGYGFVISDNQYDETYLSLKVPKETLEAASKITTLPEGASEAGINFLLTKKDPLPSMLVDFFASLVCLPSETGYTRRMKLEGLSQLRGILNTKVDVFRQFKLISTDFDSQTLQTVKKYRSSQKHNFQSAVDATNALEKKLLKTYKPLSFKSIYKKDQQFANSLLLTFGVMNYEDLFTKKLLDQAVLLYIVRVANRSYYEGEFADFIYETFQDVKRTVPVTKEDVLEFAGIYSSLFPALSNAIPEVYGVGDWSPRSFIVAGTVSDRLTFVRQANHEVFFIEKQAA